MASKTRSSAGQNALVAISLFLPFFRTTPVLTAEITADAATESTQGFWSRGLVETLGGTSHWWAWTLSILVFCFVAAKVTALAGRTALQPDLVDAESGEGNIGVAVICFLLIGGLWYVLCWGLPSRLLWWVCLAVYMSIGCLKAASVSRSERRFYITQ